MLVPRRAIIRNVIEADLPAIVEIYNAAIRGRISSAPLEEVSVEQRLPWFREHSPESYPLGVADVDGQIAAWRSFHPFIRRQAYRGTVEISIYLHEKFRGWRNAPRDLANANCVTVERSCVD